MNTTLIILAAMAVRNPFWPIGYEGVREEISAEPKVEVTPAAGPDEETATAGASAAAAEAKAAEAKSNSVIAGRHWGEARKTLRVSGTTTVTNPNGTKRHGVIINGYTYGDGDLVSTNHNGHRFTWRVQDLTEGATLKLVRVRTKPIEEESKGED